MSSYFEPGASWLKSGTTSVPVSQPDIITANFALLTSGGASAYGAWTTLVAAAVLTGHMLIGFSFNLNSPGNMAVVDIGVGAAGSETVIGTWPQVNLTSAGLSGYFPVIPFLIIPANARVAARLACNVGAQGAQIAAVFLPQPIT